jgi:hypothetical protein
MLLDFRILPFKSNVGYDVVLAIDTLIQHQLFNLPAHTTPLNLPTQIYGSADFQSAIKQLRLDFADIFCREVKSEPVRVEPLKVDIDWDKWRIPKNGGSSCPQSTEKWRRRGHKSSGRSSLISSNPQNRHTTVMCT